MLHISNRILRIRDFYRDKIYLLGFTSGILKKISNKKNHKDADFARYLNK